MRLNGEFARLYGTAVLIGSLGVMLVGFVVATLIVRRQWTVASAFTIAALVVIAPFPARNYWVNGSWWPTRSGQNLYVGNSLYAPALIPDYDVDLLLESAHELVVARRPDLSPDLPGTIALSICF